MVKAASIALLCATASGPAVAAGFDCAKAVSLVEKAICSDKALSDMDSDLSRRYKAALADSRRPAALKDEQKSWLAQRDRCRDVACLTAAYQTRLIALGASASASPASGGVTGTYKSRDGEIQILQTGPDHIRFSVFATYKMNTGEVSGEARLSNGSAVYTDAETDCRIAFAFSARRLTVDQEGICGMGLNVSSTGDYGLADTKPPKL